ncbi:NifU-like domain-containing protein [Pelagophyceae sp. CCMP2097]|nr:NifU-like domain-containing protein [Pelagophyceae sp. CCMP2097]
MGVRVARSALATAHTAAAAATHDRASATHDLWASARLPSRPEKFLSPRAAPLPRPRGDASRDCIKRLHPGAPRRGAAHLLETRLESSFLEYCLEYFLEYSPQIESPFKPSPSERDPDDDDDEDDEDAVDGVLGVGDILPLTLENVERILDELRPYLISDGGNVKVAAIDGPIVRLEHTAALVGACGTCPSSTMTMKMGLERRLMEAIPEISEVVQAMPDSPALTVDALEEVLNGVRPFLAVAGGEIVLVELSGAGSPQPSLILALTGSSASLYSVKQEITQRIHRYFMLSGLQVTWQ